VNKDVYINIRLAKNFFTGAFLVQNTSDQFTHRKKSCSCVFLRAGLLLGHSKYSYPKFIIAVPLRRKQRWRLQR